MDIKLKSKDNLWKVFKYLDSDGNDLLTYDSLKQAFQRKGDFNQYRFVQMMDEIGLKFRPKIDPPTPAH
jgi:hypothetical protein